MSRGSSVSGWRAWTAGCLYVSVSGMRGGKSEERTLHRGPSSAVEVLAPRRNAVEVARKRRLAPVPYNKNSLLPRARPLHHPPPPPRASSPTPLYHSHPSPRPRPSPPHRATWKSQDPARGSGSAAQRLRGKQLLEYGSLRRSLRGPPGAPLPIWRVGRTRIGRRRERGRYAIGCAPGPENEGPIA